MLVERGANVNMVDDEGTSALILAALTKGEPMSLLPRWTSHECVFVYRDTDCGDSVALLLDAGAKVTSCCLCVRIVSDCVCGRLTTSTTRNKLLCSQPATPVP